MNGPEVLVTYAFCGHQGILAIPMKNGVGALHSQQLRLCPSCEAVDGDHATCLGYHPEPYNVYEWAQWPSRDKESG